MIGLALHARKPAAAAHDANGPVLVKVPSAAGATARAPAGAEALLASRTAPDGAAEAAAPAGSSPEAQEAGTGAAAGAATSAAASTAPCVKTHHDVPGAEELPAVKRGVIDGSITLAAQYTAAAAAATDPVRRDLFKMQAEYLARFPAEVVSEYQRAKQRDKGAGAAGKTKELRFPRADLKAAVGMPVPASIAGAVPGVKVGDLFPNRTMARLVGLLKPPIRGIEDMMIDGRPVTTAVVDSGIYADNFSDETFDTMMYTGEGANDGLGNKEQKGDQSADVRCNRALAGAAELAPSGHLIRVLVKVQGGFMQSRMQFLFIGMYAAENFRFEPGNNGYAVCRVTLRRAAGQEPLSAEALELLRTAVRIARETSDRNKKRARDAAIKKEEGGDGPASPPPRPAKHARAPAPPRAAAEGDGGEVDEVAQLTATDTPKLVLQVLVRGINAAAEASGAACGESITTLLGQNKTRQANFVLALRPCWGALSVTQLIAAGKEAFAAGLAAGTGKAADDAATAALLPLLKAGPTSAGTPPPAAPHSKRVGAGRAPRRLRAAAAPADSADDDADGEPAERAAPRATPRRVPRAALRRRIIASSDDGDTDAAAVDVGDAAPEAAALDALSPLAVKVLCEALEVDAGLASALPPAALVAQVREARLTQWPCLSERQLAALVRHAAGGSEMAAEVDEWRTAIIAGIEHAAQAAAAPEQAAANAAAGPRGRSARRRAGPAPWLMDASVLPSDDDDGAAQSDSDPDFSPSAGEDVPRRRGRRQASSAEEEEEDEEDDDDDEGDDDDDDDEDEVSLASESEQVAAARRLQRHSARCAGGRFVSRKRAVSPSASPPPPPEKRAARAAKPRAETQPRAALQLRAARPALELLNAAAAAVGATAEAAASAPVEPAAEAPKTDNPAAVAAAASGGSSVEFLLEFLLSLNVEIPQAEPLTDDELCKLVMRFTAYVPPPPSLNMSEEEEAAAAHELARNAALEMQAREALQRIETYKRIPALASKISTLVFRAKFLAR